VDGETRLWNSLFAIDELGDVAAVYDKRHLVPFGEYVPLRSILPLDKLTQGGSDFSPGDGARSMRLPGLPEVSVLICYEVIFPGRVVDAGSNAKWLLNITNDAWFGTSSGPYQHFAAARLRAVEEGLPLVRAANTGISAVVDSYGRVVAHLGLNRTGVIDAPLPKALEKRTPFARLGSWSLLILLIVTFSLARIVRRLP
jgi:apolipoprotein N-acyltransferase